MLDQNKIKRVHCIGIGGVGVCGVAELLLGHGFLVSGSDIKESANTKRLAKLGATIFIGHQAEHVQGVDLVVYTSAVNDANPELRAAKALGIALMQRAQMLSELMSYGRGIAVSGTHGKTTATSLIAHILLEAGLDPSFAIGGELKGVNQYAHLGTGDFFVAEADESDASFIHFHPEIAIVNNIEPDHMSTYDDCFVRLKNTFLDFLGNVSENGLALLCADDKEVMSLIASPLHCDVKTYGFNDKADIKAKNFSQKALVSHFTLVTEHGLFPMTLNLPGQHNVQNALAAIAVAMHVGVSLDDIAKALASFPGVGRRFYIHGEIAVKEGSALVIDDYGHHPSAITVTLNAAKQAWPDRRIVLAFQPHRYTRTRDLLMDFAQSLASADVLLLLEVFSAGEAVIENASGQVLCDKVSGLGKVVPVYVPNIESLPKALEAVLEPGDIVLLQGAGSIGSLAKKLVA